MAFAGAPTAAGSSAVARFACRATAFAGAALLVLSAASPALAVAPPDVLVGTVPPDGPPGPELPTKQDKGCQTAGVLPNSDLVQVPPPERALELRQARALTRGAGVTVAVLDTGVSPDTRLPNLIGGGDYVQAGGDGLYDCDAHGTLVAGIIGGAADPADGFTGVAPDARIVSIRYRSGAFSLDNPPQNFDAVQQASLDVRTMARAITHAANLGAGVITVSVPICLPVSTQVDQSMLSQAIGYAVHVRGALIVAGAGNTGGSGCGQNPAIDPSRPFDPRNWDAVKTIATPSWYSTDVLTVGFTTAAGETMDDSLTGPWVSVGAPGTGIESLGPGGPSLINGVGAGDKLVPVGGASFAAAYVSGVAALLRSRFPNETPAEITARLVAGAHAPARGVDNTVGAGVIDALESLSYRTPPKPPADTARGAMLVMPPPRRPVDWRPRTVVGIVFGVVILFWPVSAGLRAVFRRKP
ncbi:type VII secretion-associated serine protease mycosin [Nocardia stercoris]|uniref:type VII secretion-associated serine protease mycosin n=1 Tax=Nocardia stercoris TaxID=2483361 RepID=UPI001F434872|nr:type VII secretion-associated serine protease mycosin [Nocardia stercoris]